MEWRTEGILLAKRRHGETGVIITVFTELYGRRLGMVRGGVSRKIAPVLQPGSQLDLTWRARLDEHLGTFKVEPVKSRAAMVMSDRLALSGLNTVLALLDFILPEGESHPVLYRSSKNLLDLLGQDPLWPRSYVLWECALLKEAGFGLDLETCAVNGSAEDLVYVSPRSGRAVSSAGAGEWASRLLPLPPCLRENGGDATIPEIVSALHTTGYFLSTKLAPALGERPLPDDRERFVTLLCKLATMQECDRTSSAISL